jgi:hypothetical protein
MIKGLISENLARSAGEQRARREIMLVCHFSRRARLDSLDISPHFGLNNQFTEIPST